MQLNIISKPKEALYIRRNNSKVNSIDRGRIIIAYFRGGSKTAATSKMERFLIIVNYYHKALHLGYCSRPRSVSAFDFLILLFRSFVRRIS